MKFEIEKLVLVALKIVWHVFNKHGDHASAELNLTPLLLLTFNTTRHIWDCDIFVYYMIKGFRDLLDVKENDMQTVNDMDI